MNRNIYLSSNDLNIFEEGNIFQDEIIQANLKKYNDSDSCEKKLNKQLNENDNQVLINESIDQYERKMNEVKELTNCSESQSPLKLLNQKFNQCQAKTRNKIDSNHRSFTESFPECSQIMPNVYVNPKNELSNFQEKAKKDSLKEKQKIKEINEMEIWHFKNSLNEHKNNGVKLI